MPLTSNKTSISRLVEICAAHGIRNVVFSPGSRNAPLIIAFNNDDRFKCICIHDERVAAFYAIGVSLATKAPTVLGCTSGTAALNYAPAVAEAYYQKVPLLICTADRPVEWIDQGNGQTIRQSQIYGRHVHGSFDLLQEVNHVDEIWYNDRIANEAILNCIKNRGPVHINIPLREPLYEVVPISNFEPKVISRTQATKELAKEDWREIAATWSQAKRKIIMVGQSSPNSLLTGALTALTVDKSVVLMTETTSNVHVSGQVSCIDRTIEGIDEDFDHYQPEILLTLGGEIVSKKVKALFRKHKPKVHWHISEEGQVMDTYQALTRVIEMEPISFLEGLMTRSQPHWDANFASTWKSLIKHRANRHQTFYENAPWSDLKAFGAILAEVPSQSILHLANSTPIRYHQLFNQRFDLENYCNRGTSGIDGSTSTAVGMAAESEKMVTIITGDTSFFYDSNALWVRPISKQLRIILINNSGGNIFRVIPGPDTTKELEDFFEAYHDAMAEGVANAFDMEYLKIASKEELEKALPYFFKENDSGPKILEVVTPRLENDKVLKDYFSFITDSNSDS